MKPTRFQKDHRIHVRTPSTICICHVENQQFAKPGKFPQLYCKGRLCATCGRCRDWHFKGDRKTWTWIRDIKNWKGMDWDRYRDGDFWQCFHRHDGATCIYKEYDCDSLSYDLEERICLCDDSAVIVWCGAYFDMNLFCNKWRITQNLFISICMKHFAREYVFRKQNAYQISKAILFEC